LIIAGNPPSIRAPMRMRQLLSAKLHGGRVTQCDLHYEGSCGLGEDLLKATGILPLEKVSVLNVSTGGRLETYVIHSKKPGEISLNGAAARHASVGDKIIILTYAVLPENELKDHKARIVILDDENKVVSSRDESPSI
jgi:aspartate 1-decarboxylase